QATRPANGRRPTANISSSAGAAKSRSSCLAAPQHPPRRDRHTEWYVEAAAQIYADDLIGNQRIAHEIERAPRFVTRKRGDPSQIDTGNDHQIVRIAIFVISLSISVHAASVRRDAVQLPGRDIEARVRRHGSRR